MTKCKPQNPILYLLLVFIFFTSCNRQTSTSQTTNNINSKNKTEQHPKIVRTMGTQCENIGCQLLDKDGNLWFNISGEGAYCYDGKSLTNFTMKDGLCNNNVGAIIQDRVGNILLGTRNGICCYDGKTFTSIGGNEGLGSGGATAILQDDKNGFGITAFDSGVWYFDGKIFKNFTENNRLVNNAVMNVLKDKNGNLWFGTKWFGLSRYDGKTFTTFSQYGN